MTIDSHTTSASCSTRATSCTDTPDFNNGGGDFAYIYYTGDASTIDFDTTANYSPVGASAGYSVQLSAADLSATASSDVSNWCASGSEIGSTGDYGTPGASNAVCR